MRIATYSPDIRPLSRSRRTRCPCVELVALVLSSLPLCCPYSVLVRHRPCRVRAPARIPRCAGIYLRMPFAGGGAGLAPRASSRQDTSPAPLYLVERPAFPVAPLPEFAGRYARDAFELGAQVRRARIVEFVGDLAEGQFIVYQQFLDPFDPLCNVIFSSVMPVISENNLLRAL